MKIGIISGSHRPDAQSLKVARYIEGVLQNNTACDATWLLSLDGNPLPLWDEGVWDKTEEWESLLNPIREQLRSCDGFIVVAPEWHGQVPAGLKNFFLLASKFELGHKPGLIVTVSSADGGAYPVAELRMSSYKNNRLCWIPEHVILRHVEKILNDDPGDNDTGADSYFRERIDWALDILLTYAKGLAGVREQWMVAHDKFRNGM